MGRYSRSDVFVKPQEIFDLLDRRHERQRILLSGLEAIVYNHTHKKFYFGLENSDYKNLTAKTGYPLCVEVYDYGMRVGKVSTFQPDGQERTKLQVQFEYDYDVHQKEPRNVKRSSDHRKIVDFAKLFRPIDFTKPNVLNEMFNGVVSAIGGVTKLRNRSSGVNKLLEGFYYGNKSTNAELMYNLIHNMPSPAAIEFKQKFETAYAESKAADDEFHSLTRRIAVITSTPYGDYLVCRYEHKGKPTSKDLEDRDNYHGALEVFESRDAIPEDIIGKMSVLEISNTSDEDVEIDGVGVYWKNNNRMIIMGEDLNGIDTGTEGQNPSSQSS